MWEKIKAYILYDYGFDIDKFNKKISDKVHAFTNWFMNDFYGSKKFVTIVLILFFPLAGLLAGSILALSLAYPAVAIVWCTGSIIGLLYILLRDKLSEKILL